MLLYKDRDPPGRDEVTQAWQAMNVLVTDLVSVVLTMKINSYGEPGDDGVMAPGRSNTGGAGTMTMTNDRATTVWTRHTDTALAAPRTIDARNSLPRATPTAAALGALDSVQLDIVSFRVDPLLPTGLVSKMVMAL